MNKTSGHTNQIDNNSACYYARNPKSTDYPQPEPFLTDKQIEDLRIAMSWLAGLENKKVSHAI